MERRKTGIAGAQDFAIYREPTRVVGIDIHGLYLEFCSSMRSYDEFVQ